MSKTFLILGGYGNAGLEIAGYLLQYLDGSARKPGLHMMGHRADLTRLLQVMQRMGATVERNGGAA